MEEDWCLFHNFYFPFQEKKQETNPKKEYIKKIKIKYEKNPWYTRIDLWEPPLKFGGSKFYETHWP